MSALKPLKKHAGTALVWMALAAMLYLVVLLYTVGEGLLAATLLVLVGLASWIYSSDRLQAYRYLFPGIAAALVFVVFPMVYTIAISFTNYGSTNLLDHERARAYLLQETFTRPGDKSYQFALLQSGQAHQLRLVDAQDPQRVWVTPSISLKAQAQRVDVIEARGEALTQQALPIKEVIANKAGLSALTLVLPDGAAVKQTSLRTFATQRARYQLESDGSLRDLAKPDRLLPDWDKGYFVRESSGEAVQPGFKVNVGLAHYAQIFTDQKFREPFIRIFVWTVLFSGLTVFFATALGLLLAVLLSWENLRFRKAYQLLLFLPYAVPGFISILIFKGLFNQNLGEVNMILSHLFGIRPAWFSDPMLAKTMLLIVNTWLGFPYMMIVCMGMIKSIPADLYEASAVAGAGPLTNFFSITMPLIVKPLTPLLISSFAFNFNNFVLITLLTGGRPDFLDTQVPAGTTDILVSYTFRIAFQDSGQHFGLASAISAVIFLIVATITLVQMRFTRVNELQRR